MECLATVQCFAKINKMKTIIAAFIFVVALGLCSSASSDSSSSEERKEHRSASVDSSSSEESKEYKVHHLKKYLNESGYLDKVTDPLDEWCSGASDKIEKALDKVIECDSAIPDTVTTCESVRTHGLRCFQPFIKVISECLPEKSKELPETLLKSLISAFDFICKQDGEHILELANSCVYDFDDNDTKMKTCVEESKEFMEKFRNGPPTKHEVCNFANLMKSCASHQVNKACRNEKTKRANIGFMDAMLAPCNEA